MASKIDAPFVDAQVDPSDPAGSAMSILYGIIGVAVAFLVFAGGQKLYNAIAQNTPDAVQPAEVF